MKFSSIRVLFLIISIISGICLEPDTNCVNNGKQIFEPSLSTLDDAKAFPEVQRINFDELLSNFKEDLKNEHETLSNEGNANQWKSEQLKRKYRNLWSRGGEENAKIFTRRNDASSDKMELGYDADHSVNSMDSGGKPLPEILSDYRKNHVGDDSSGAVSKNCKEANGGAGKNNIKDNRRPTERVRHYHEGKRVLVKKVYNDDDANHEFSDNRFNSNIEYPDDDDDEDSFAYDPNLGNSFRNILNLSNPKRPIDSTKPFERESTKLRKNPNMCYLCDECKTFDPETMNYFTQQNLRFERPSSTTERVRLFQISKQYELTPLRDSKFNNSTQPKTYFGFNKVHINPIVIRPSNDQFEITKNNLSHEANYKLSKLEQDAGEKPSNSSWLWRYNWGSQKRSLERFNPMNEIKLKTSSRLMKKGFGPSLPSYSLSENRRDLMIAKILKRKEMELGKEDRIIKNLETVSAVEDQNKLMGQENGVHDLEVNSLEPIFNTMELDWDNIRSGHKRQKREVKESENNKEATTSIREEFKGNSSKSINNDLGKIKLQSNPFDSFDSKSKSFSKDQELMRRSNKANRSENFNDYQSWKANRNIFNGKKSNIVKIPRNKSLNFKDNNLKRYEKLNLQNPQKILRNGILYDNRNLDESFKSSKRVTVKDSEQQANNIDRSSNRKVNNLNSNSHYSSYDGGFKIRGHAISKVHGVNGKSYNRHKKLRKLLKSDTSGQSNNFASKRAKIKGKLLRPVHNYKFQSKINAHSLFGDNTMKVHRYSNSKAFRIKKNRKTRNKKHDKSLRNHGYSKAFDNNDIHIKSFETKMPLQLSNLNNDFQNYDNANNQNSQIQKTLNKHSDKRSKTFDPKDKNFTISGTKTYPKINNEGEYIDMHTNFDIHKSKQTAGLLKTPLQSDGLKKSSKILQPKAITDHTAKARTSESSKDIQPEVSKSKSSHSLGHMFSNQSTDRGFARSESFIKKFKTTPHSNSSNSSGNEGIKHNHRLRRFKSSLDSNANSRKHHVKKRDVSYFEQQDKYFDEFQNTNDLEDSIIEHTPDSVDNHLDALSRDLKWHRTGRNEGNDKTLRKREEMTKNPKSNEELDWRQQNHKPMKNSNHEQLKGKYRMQRKSSRIPQRQPNRKKVHPNKKRPKVGKSSSVQHEYDLNQSRPKWLRNSRNNFNKYGNSYTWFNDARLHNPNKRYGLVAKDLNNTVLEPTSLDLSKYSTELPPSDSSNDFNDSKKISLELRNEILNCTAFSTLEEFLKSLPKNLTQTLSHITTTQSPEVIEMDFTTLDIGDVSSDIPDWNTTEASETEKENLTSSSEAGDFQVPTGSDTFETTTIDFPDITEMSSELADMNDMNNQTLSTPMPDIDEPSCDDFLPGGLSTTEFSTFSSLDSSNGDVNLNITINAKVLGNSTKKKFTGNGTINVIPGYDDDRFRRHAYKLSMAGEDKRANGLKQECDTIASENAYDDGSFDDLASGKVSANIVKAVFGEVQENPELSVLWPSLKQNRLTQPSQMPNLYSIRNKDNEEQMQRTQNLFSKTMNAINDIIDQQVGSRSCVVLKPDLQEFYDLIVQTNQQQDKHRDIRQKVLSKHRNSKGNNLMIMDPSQIEEKSKTVKKLLRQYNELSQEDQKEVEPLKDELISELADLQGMSDAQGRSRREMLDQDNISVNKPSDKAIEKLLEKYYTPQFLKLQKACDYQRNAAAESNDDGMSKI